MDDEDQLEAQPSDVGEPPEPEPEPVSGRPGKFIVIAALMVSAAIGVTGWMVGHPRAIQLTQTYQAVLLSNGQVYFGRLEGYGTSNPVLTEVYYVQSVVNPDTKEQSNILLRRGKEWHGPDRMYINPQQIIIVEPVSPQSRVGELIKDLKLQR